MNTGQPPHFSTLTLLAVDGSRQLLQDDQQCWQGLASRQEQFTCLIRLLIHLAVICHCCKQLLPLLLVRHKLLNGAAGPKAATTTQKGSCTDTKQHDAKCMQSAHQPNNDVTPFPCTA